MWVGYRHLWLRWRFRLKRVLGSNSQHLCIDSRLFGRFPAVNSDPEAGDLGVISHLNASENANCFIHLVKRAHEIKMQEKTGQTAANTAAGRRSLNLHMQTRRYEIRGEQERSSA